MHHITRLSAASAILFISAGAHCTVIINEVDYDQPGTDTAEFIELYNAGATPVSLDDFSIQLINGTNSSVYRNIDLTGQGIAEHDYFVICSDTVAVANCDLAFTTSSSWLQNGAPDGVSLYSGSSLFDSMSYEGNISGFTEGEALFLEDSNSDIMSIARIPNGQDTDDNFSDFQTACITPGSANIAGVGDCSQLAVNPVPVPAALWLFASGLLGMTAVARRAERKRS